MIGILVGIGILAAFGVGAWGVIVAYVARADALDAREIARDAREAMKGWPKPEKIRVRRMERLEKRVNLLEEAK